MKKTGKYVIALILFFIASVFVGLVFSGCQTVPDINGDSNNEVFNVVYTTDGNGTIQGEAAQTVAYGESASAVIAIPNPGYKFSKWSDGVETAERTDTKITREISAVAQFKKLNFTVGYMTDGNGTINGNTNQSVAYGENASEVIAIPNQGYKFLKWSDGITTPERQDKSITVDKSVTAEFEKIKITVTYTASEGGTIDGITKQQIEYGEDAVAVVAVPQTGYRFVKWSDGNGSAIRRELNVTSETCLTAEFEFLYAGGDGSASNPFLITTYSQLNNMRYYPDSNYKLLNDLDLTGINHEPIFDDATPFAGAFNGANHTITNLTVNTESNFPSLFGFIGNGSVAYLNLASVDVRTFNFDTVSARQNYYVGAIAGVSFGFLHDITVSGAITANGLYYDGVAIGGLVGMANSTVANCTTDMQIKISDAQRNNNTGITLPYVFGGLVGVGDSTFIRECEVGGAIKVMQSSPNEITTGGLIGYYFTDRQVETSINDCTTNVEIYCDSYYDAGGFIGRVDVASNTSLQILNGAVYGDITAGYVGGFIGSGSCYGLLNVEKCHAESEINILARGAGFIDWFSCSSSTNSSIKDCYSTCRITGDLDADSGRASGFSHSISGINIIRCFVESDISTTTGTGFIHSLSNCNVEQCYYWGIITCKTGGSGFFRGVSSSRIQNCYSVAKIYPTRSSKQLYGFAQVVQSSEIINCYCAGGNFVKIISSVRNSNILNFHTIKPIVEGELIDSITDDIGIQIDVTPYDSVDEMFSISAKLNKDLDEEVWVNVENGLPKLKYTTVD